MLNIALDIRKKVVLGFISALATSLLMILLIPQYQLYGLCVALLLGRLPLQIIYPKIINKYLNVSVKEKPPIRKTSITTLMLAISWFVSSYVFVDNWIGLLILSGIFFILVVTLVYILGVNVTQKAIINNRYRQVRSMINR